jgi:hypothetical protein
VILVSIVLAENQVTYLFSVRCGAANPTPSAIQSRVFFASPFAGRKVLILALNWQLSDRARYFLRSLDVLLRKI